MVNHSESYYSGRFSNNSAPETIIIINCVLNAPLMFITIIGNALVSAAILRTPSLRSPSTILLAWRFGSVRPSCWTRRASSLHSY